MCKAYTVSIADAVTKDTDEACEDQIHKIRGSYIFEFQKTDVQVNLTVLLIDGTVKITRFTMFVRSVGGLFRECTSPFTDSVKDLVMKKLEELREVKPIWTDDGLFDDKACDYCKADVDTCKRYFKNTEPIIAKKIIPTSSSIIPNKLQEQLYKALLENKQDFDLDAWAKKECKRILNSMYGTASMSVPEVKYCIDDLSIIGRIRGADYDGDVISKEEIQNIIKGDNTMAIEKFVITPAVINEEIYNVAKEFFTHDRLMQIDMDFANEVRYVSIIKDEYLSDIRKARVIVTKRLELGTGNPVASDPLSVDVHYSPGDNSFPEIAVEGAFPVIVLKAFRVELEKRFNWLHCVRFCHKPDNELEVRLRNEKAAIAKLLHAYNAKDAALKVDRVIANYPAVIVFWKDSSKTIVKAQNGDQFDIEKGVAMAFAKKALGNDYAAGGRFKAILKHVQIETKHEPKKKEDVVSVDKVDPERLKKADFVKQMLDAGFTKAEAERAWKGMNSKEVK